MINIIITVDYEIFGDGSGYIKECLIEPMNEILNICNKFGVKLTVFFDICEYWAFEKAEQENLLNDLGYSPVDLINKQIKRLVEHGHDVQLHLHPQWLDAKYENGKWQLNFDKFRVADLAYPEMKALFLKAKHDLEEIVKPYNPTYRCIAFRAGAFSIQPSMHLLKALKEVGILIDSSVVKGFAISDGLFKFDFRKAPGSFEPWWVSEDILKSVNKKEAKVLEVPIYSKVAKRFWYFLLLKIQYLTGIKKNIQRMYPREYSLTQKLSLRNKLTIDYLKYILKDMGVAWDFCELSHREMISLLKEAIKKKTTQGISYLPLVMIGHPKLYDNCSHFERFLKFTYDNFVKKGIVNFGTFHDLKDVILD